MSENPVSNPAVTSITNIMAYGSPSAKAEIIVKLIYLENPDVLQRVYDSITDKELERIIGFA